MKRFLCLTLLIMCVLTAQAQGYVGGNLGFKYNRPFTTSAVIVGGNTQFSIAPEIGYSFNKYLAVGASFRFRFENGGVSYFSVVPYTRFTFAQWEHFGLFVDALFDYTTSLPSSSGSKVQTWDAGLAPGIKIPITSKYGLTTRFAFLGWRHIYKESFFMPTVSFINSSTVGFYCYL